MTKPTGIDSGAYTRGGSPQDLTGEVKDLGASETVWVGECGCRCGSRTVVGDEEDVEGGLGEVGG